MNSRLETYGRWLWRGRETGHNKMGTLVLWFGLTLLCVWVWTPTFTQKSNTLKENGRWVVGKLQLAHEVMGSTSFYTGYQSLASLTLNLGAWHGHQEVYTGEALAFRSLSFDFFFSKPGYIITLLDFGGDEYAGIRISTDTAEWEPALLHTKYTGEFTGIEVLPLPAISLGEWHSAYLKYAPDGISLSIDGAEAIGVKVALEPEQHIGFTCGLEGVLVDNVRARGRFGQTVFLEAFDNSHIRRQVQFTLLLSALGLCLLLALAMLLFKFPRNSLLPNLIAVMISLAAAGYIVSNFYLPVLTSKYPKISPELLAKEKNWVDQVRNKTLRKIEKNFYGAADKNTVRCIVVGTSQTSGSGAYLKGEGLVEQLEQILNHADTPYAYECINLGINGSWSTPLFDEYQGIAPQVKPQVCIINLGYNDQGHSVEEFQAALKEFVRYNREQGILTLFVKEAASPERLKEGAMTHATMIEVASELKIPVVDTHDYLLKRRTTGLLWWDYVHPTSYGHRLIAECIAEGFQRDILPVLKSNEVETP